MVVGPPTRHGLPAWMSAASRVDFDAKIPSAMADPSSSSPPSPDRSPPSSDSSMGFAERAMSAAGAAVLSAIIVNPLDVAKTRLQAQAAGVLYSHSPYRFGPDMVFSDIRCSPSCTRGVILGTGPFCPPDCFQYKSTMDVFSKVIRQEGLARLWRGTNAALALSVPTVGIYLPCYDIFRNRLEEFTAQNAPSLTPYAPLVAGTFARSLACVSCYPIELARTRMQAFKELRPGDKPPGIWKTLLGVVSPARSLNSHQNLQSYRMLWTGVGAQLARDVPFSAICWSTLEPIRRRLRAIVGDEENLASILGANFPAAFFAGSLAAAATCPLDVAKTRRQIERDPTRALSMTTRQTLVEIWRDGGLRGLFMGVGPRVARAGPSTGIVLSFYEVVKYALHQKYTN